jgi:hypothetical protein
MELRDHRLDWCAAALSCLLALARLAAQEPSAPSPGLRERLAGAWELRSGGHVLHFDGDRCVFAEDGRQALFTVEYGDGRIRRHGVDGGVDLDEKVAWTEGGMTLTYPGGREVGYRRLPAVPDDARIEPLALGTRAPDAAEIARLAAELRERTGRDQAVREEIGALMAPRDGKPRDEQAVQAVMRRMHGIDVENTHRLAAIVADLGWIDRVRFPERASADAFLLVQHSGNLRLMQAVLPLLEAEARAHAEVGQEFALLYDRTQLSLGKPQRYGSQLREDSQGVWHVVRLPDQQHVDERRRTVGLGPFEEYFELFRKRGSKVVVDPQC